MKFGMTPSPYQRTARRTHHIMWELTAALVLVWIAAIVKHALYDVSGLALSAFFIPFSAIVTTFVLEALVSLTTIKDLKKKPEVLSIGFLAKHALKYFNNSFGYVSALIFALTLPVGTPIWIVVVGTIITIGIGRLVFGGFGYNLVNPAALGRVFVTAAFPAALVVLLGQNGVLVEAGATITNIFTKNGLIAENLTYLFSRDSEMFGINLLDLYVGNYAGALGETFTFLLLGIIVVLAIRKVLDWRLSISYLVTIGFIAAVFALVNGLPVVTYVLGHWGVGGVMFAAAFMVTDPVTTPTSRFGKVIWGIIAGTLTFMIRTLTGYPEGVVFSILLANLLTSAIDMAITGKTTAKLPIKWGITAAALASSLVITVLPLNGKVAAVTAYVDDPFLSIALVRPGVYRATALTHNDATETFFVYVDYANETIYRIDSFDAALEPTRQDVLTDFFTNPAAASNQPILDYFDEFFANDFSLTFAEAAAYSIKKTDFNTLSATYTTMATRSVLKQVAALAATHPLANATVEEAVDSVYNVSLGAGAFGIVQLTVTVDKDTRTVLSVEDNGSTLQAHESDGIPDFFDGVSLPEWIGTSLSIDFDDVIAINYTSVGPKSGEVAPYAGATWSSKAIVLAIQAVVLAVEGE